MSDISISFPPWMIAWFLLGEATPFITLVLMGLAAAFFFSRGTARVRRVRWLKWALAIVGGLWLGGISFWAAGLVDQIKTDIYQAQHHYRLDNATVLAGIDIPRGSWISLDEEGVLYGIETAPDAMVSIDRALWRGDIHLIPSHSRTTADRGVIKSATLAADAAVQGIPCRAGMLVEFSEYGGDLQHCTLTQRIGVTAEIDEGQGGKSTKDLACAADRDVWLRTFERRLLERCVLAEPATIGLIACADGKEIVLSGDGLDICTLASAQRVGPARGKAFKVFGAVRVPADRYKYTERALACRCGPCAEERFSGIDFHELARTDSRVDVEMRRTPCLDGQTCLISIGCCRSPGTVAQEWPRICAIAGALLEYRQLSYDELRRLVR